MATKRVLEDFIQDEFDKLCKRILHPEKRLRNGYYERSLLTPFGLFKVTVYKFHKFMDRGNYEIRRKKVY